MPNFKLEVEGVSTEYYSVEAESEEEARAIFYDGRSGPADYTEVNQAEVIYVEKEEQ
jgi:hypothetical protein